MKKVLLTWAICLISVVSFSQTTNTPFSFQGYSADPDGKAMASTAITVKFTLENSNNPAVASSYAEEHNVTTDEFGVFSAKIGSGSRIAAEGALPFAAINMNLYTYKLKVEVKKTAGGAYTVISNEVMTAVPYARSAENGVPTGTIVAYGGDITKIPDGWAYCDGSAVDRTSDEWKKLFEVIGTGWGNGGGGNNFSLPELRGSFLRGLEDDSPWNNDPDADARTSHNGGNAGNMVGTYQPDEFRSHSHGYKDIFPSTYCCNATGFPQSPMADLTSMPEVNAANYAQWLRVSDGAGGNETRPKNFAVYYIIKK